MRVPSALFGTADVVAGTAAPWVRECLSTNVWPGDDAEGIDPSDCQAPVLIGFPSPAWTQEPSFHPYFPALELTRAVVEEDLSPTAEQDAFDQWLTATWSLAGLLAPVNVTWFRQPSRFRPFIAAVVERWDELSAPGLRYTDGGFNQTALWFLSSNVKYVLANMGLDPTRLSEPLPLGGLADLATEVVAWDGVPVIERWN